jgi:hypothetical protein
MSGAEQRTTQVGIFTRAGWVTGALHVAAGESLAAFLDGSERLFRLTDVQLPAEAAPREFFAMYAEEALMVLPLERSEQYLPAPAGSLRRDVGCLLAEGTLFGALDVPPGARVSDYLTSERRFLPVRRARTPLFELPADVAEPLEMIYVNARRIIGVTETNPVDAEQQPALVNPYIEV